MRHGLYRRCAVCGHGKILHSEREGRGPPPDAPVCRSREESPGDCLCPGFVPLRPRRATTPSLFPVEVRVEPQAAPAVLEFWYEGVRVGLIEGLRLKDPRMVALIRAVRSYLDRPKEETAQLLFRLLAEVDAY